MPALTYNTPGLLFPAISLLMLAYTNRFLGLASLVRHLVSQYRSNGDRMLEPQIENLRRRLTLMRHAQGIGGASLLLCTMSILALFTGSDLFAGALFAAALIAMVTSLGVSLLEIHLSTRALDVELARFATNTRPS